MAIESYFLNIVVPRSIIEEKYPGGVMRLKEEWGGICADRHLVRFYRMSGGDLGNLRKELIAIGLTPPSKDVSTPHIAEFDHDGLFTACDWLELGWDAKGVLYVWMKGTPFGRIAKANGFVEDITSPPAPYEIIPLSPEPPPYKRAAKGTLSEPKEELQRALKHYQDDFITTGEVFSRIAGHIQELCQEDLNDFLKYLCEKGLDVSSSPLFHRDKLTKHQESDEVYRVTELVFEKIMGFRF